MLPGPRSLPPAAVEPSPMAGEDPGAEPTPPRAKAPPVVGLLPQFIRSRSEVLNRLYRELGPCFELPLGGEAPTVLAGPEMARFATKDAGKVLRAGPSNLPFVQAFGGSNMMLGSDLEAHSQRRRALMPSFTPAAVMRMVPEFERCAREMALSWVGQPAFELLPELKRLVTRQTGLALVGSDSSAVHDSLCRFFDLAIAMCFARVPAPIVRVFGYEKQRARVLDFAQSLLDARLAIPEPERPGDFLDLILAARDADGSPLEPGEARGLVLTPFIGGLDTVSHTLAFLLYEVLVDPALRARCQAEADHLFEGGSLRSERFRELPTLTAAALETLRFHPVTEVGQRVAAEDFEFEGYRVARGTPLILAWTVGNFVDTHFAESQRFDVDRFLPPRSEGAHHNGAFGFGPHRCIGAKLGEVQLIVTLATLLHATAPRLERPAAPLKTSSLVALKPVNLKLVVEARSAAAQTGP